MTYMIKDMMPMHSNDVARLWHSGWIDGHAEIVPKALCELRTLKSFQIRTLTQLGNTRVALSEGNVLGFAMVQSDEIYQMYVGADARGTGVAQALMQDGEARIQASGHSVAWLACAVGNERAERFYLKSGWINKRTALIALDTLADPFHLEIWRFEKALD